MADAVPFPELPATLLSERAMCPHRDLLEKFARRYIWWMEPAEALQYPARVLSQTMNIGVFRDLMQLEQAFGETTLRAVLAQAQPGEFNERSWHFWHYRLGVAEPGEVPPLPVRRIP